jgi:hypothetical protein
MVPAYTRPIRLPSCPALSSNRPVLWQPCPAHIWSSPIPALSGYRPVPPCPVTVLSYDSPAPPIYGPRLYPPYPVTVLSCPMTVPPLPWMVPPIPAPSGNRPVPPCPVTDLSQPQPSYPELKATYIMKYTLSFFHVLHLHKESVVNGISSLCEKCQSYFFF